MYTGIYSGFTEADDGLISILSTFIGLKFLQIHENLLSQEKDQRLKNLLNILNSLLGIRTYMSLVIQMREMMPILMGYEYFGIYFHNNESIFIIKLAHELCTSFHADYKAGNRNLIRYPDNTGITGKSFTDESCIISFKGKKENNFHEIDNIESYGEIKNFIVMPTYGNGDEKNGMMQLYNKKQGKIDDQEIENLKPYQRFVGLIMQNVLDIDRAIDIEMNIKNILDFLKDNTTLFLKEEIRYSSALDDIKIALENFQQLLLKLNMARKNVIKGF